MNLRVIFRSIFCLFVLGFHPISALTQSDSTIKFEQLLAASEQASESGKWTQAIHFGKSALQACTVQLSESAGQCINIMRSNTLTYQQAGELSEHAEEIERAYRVALSQLGPMHYATIKIREVFYKLTVNQNRYSETIPIVITLIHNERKTDNNEYKILEWFLELRQLYKKTDQVQYEEPTLESIVTLTKKNIGVETNDFKQAVTALANCYCKQKYYDKFDALIDRYLLDISCP